MGTGKPGSGRPGAIDAGVVLMAGGGHGVAIVPWYATLFRADKFEIALAEIAPVALRYGASEYRAYRWRDDRYRFHQFASFESETDWERYWYSPEFQGWRADYSSWYQVPVVPAWSDLIVVGGLDPIAADGSDRLFESSPGSG